MLSMKNPSSILIIDNNIIITNLSHSLTKLYMLLLQVGSSSGIASPAVSPRSTELSPWLI